MAKNESEPGPGRSGEKPKYFMVETSEGWTAFGRRFLWGTGWLCFDAGKGKHHASYRPRKLALPRLGQGSQKPERSPLNADGNPKSDFLVLLALRALHSSDPEIVRWAPSLRIQAVARGLSEREAKRGTPTEARVRENARRIARSTREFEEWANMKLMRSLESPDAAEAFARYGNWIPTIDRVLNEPPDPGDRVFLQAVETAADNVGAIPSIKKVEERFNALTSQNQQGLGSRFRTLRKRLGFDWLPKAPPGPEPKKRRVPAK